MSALAESSPKILPQADLFAAEAAGEGNLAFCRLMINYDLPWNPNRLEHMGRIHPNRTRAGCLHFNFVAANT